MAGRLRRQAPRRALEVTGGARRGRVAGAEQITQGVKSVGLDRCSGELVNNRIPDRVSGEIRRAGAGLQRQVVQAQSLVTHGVAVSGSPPAGGGPEIGADVKRVRFPRLIGPHRGEADAGQKRPIAKVRRAVTPGAEGNRGERNRPWISAFVGLENRIKGRILQADGRARARSRCPDKSESGAKETSPPRRAVLGSARPRLPVVGEPIDDPGHDHD